MLFDQACTVVSECINCPPRYPMRWEEYTTARLFNVTPFEDDSPTLEGQHLSTDLSGENLLSFKNAARPNVFTKNAYLGVCLDKAEEVLQSLPPLK